MTIYSQANHEPIRFNEIPKLKYNLEATGRIPLPVLNDKNLIGSEALRVYAYLSNFEPGLYRYIVEDFSKSLGICSASLRTALRRLVINGYAEVFQVSTGGGGIGSNIIHLLVHDNEKQPHYSTELFVNQYNHEVQTNRLFTEPLPKKRKNSPDYSDVNGDGGISGAQFAEMRKIEDEYLRGEREQNERNDMLDNERVMFAAIKYMQRRRHAKFEDD